MPIGCQLYSNSDTGNLHAISIIIEIILASPI